MRILMALLFLCIASCGSRPQKPASSPASIHTKAIIGDTTVKFLWLRSIYLPETKDSATEIVINEDYVRVMPDAARAALGYLSFDKCSECIWDGDYKDDRSNLKCKIQTALDLGYQCSDKQLNFLRNWFRNDTAVVKELESCPTIPLGSTIGSGFSEIELTIRADTIKVRNEHYFYNTREGYISYFEKEDIFLFQANEIRLIRSDLLKRKEESEFRYE